MEDALGTRRSYRERCWRSTHASSCRRGQYRCICFGGTQAVAGCEVCRPWVRLAGLGAGMYEIQGKGGWGETDHTAGSGGVDTLRRQMCLVLHTELQLVPLFCGAPDVGKDLTLVSSALPAPASVPNFYCMLDLTDELLPSQVCTLQIFLQRLSRGEHRNANVHSWMISSTADRSNRPCVYRFSESPRPIDTTCVTTSMCKNHPSAVSVTRER